MPYFKKEGCEVSQGNLKLGKDTLIFNMGSAAECPSKKLGLCKLGLKCYAHKAEVVYPGCLPYRVRQAEYWKVTPAKRIASALISIIKGRKAGIKFIRFNEAGDFYKQADITKLARVAEMVKAETGVVTYGYTARKDLNFGKVTSFLVKGSSNNSGNNGRTIARHADKLNGQKDYTEDGVYYVRCPGDCRTCSLCKVKNNVNIVFPLH